MLRFFRRWLIAALWMAPIWFGFNLLFGLPIHTGLRGWLVFSFAWAACCHAYFSHKRTDQNYPRIPELKWPGRR